MADQKDQEPSLPDDRPFLPLKKRAIAEKSLPGSSKNESDSDDSSEDEDIVNEFAEEFKNQKVEELQKEAYYSLLYAFKAEDSSVSFKRSKIIRKLMSEWKISLEDNVSVLDKLEIDLQTLQDSISASDLKGLEIVEATPLTISNILLSMNETSVPASVSSWGKFDPNSLIGKSVRIKVPHEEQFQGFVIKDYDPKQNLHRLESEESNSMEVGDFLSWMDLRQIPSEDIMWEGGEKPNFDDPNPKLDAPRSSTS